MLYDHFPSSPSSVVWCLGAMWIHVTCVMEGMFAVAL